MATDPSQDAIVLPFLAEPGVGKAIVECANPRCDEQFMRPVGSPGRPKFFHDEQCRRQAASDLRQTQARIQQHEKQLELLRAQEASYLHTAGDEETGAGPTAAQRQAARDAVLEVKGMARFLASQQGEFAADLLRLFEAVAPLVD